jgi:hypothetical protein
MYEWVCSESKRRQRVGYGKNENRLIPNEENDVSREGQSKLQVHDGTRYETRQTDQPHHGWPDETNQNTPKHIDG